jgi:hypothetical protein
MTVAIKDTESQIRESWISGSIVKIAGESDVKGRAT